MKKILFAAFLIIGVSFNARATHLRAGEITVKQSSDGLTVDITIRVYTNVINTNVLFGGEDDWLDFGDGTRMKIPEQPGTAIPSFPAGMHMAFIIVKHTYAAAGKYLISYSEPNREEGILNMDGSVNTRFYLETLITLQPGTLYSTPEFLLPPMIFAIAGEPVSLAMSCVDSMGYQLIYQTVTPKQLKNTDVGNYRLPESFSINAFNGQVSWGTKFQGAYTIGAFTFAIKVSQYNQQGAVVGYVTRDFAIIVNDGTPEVEVDDNVDLDVNNRIYVPESKSFTLKAVADPGNTTDFSLSAFSELTKLENAFQFELYDSIADDGRTLKVGKLTLTNSNEITRDLPYVVSIRSYFETGGTLMSRDLSYLFYTRDHEPSIPTPPAEEPPPIVSVERNFSTDLQVYPNPACEFIHIGENQNDMPVSYELWDTAGRIRKSGLTTPGTANDIKGLTPGLYLMIIKTKQGHTTARVIKE